MTESENWYIRPHDVMQRKLQYFWIMVIVLNIRVHIVVSDFSLFQLAHIRDISAQLSSLTGHCCQFQHISTRVVIVCNFDE